MKEILSLIAGAAAIITLKNFYDKTKNDPLPAKTKLGDTYEPTPYQKALVTVAKDTQIQRDLDFLLQSLESGKYSSHYFKATGTSDKALQLERIILGAGGGIDQIRSSGYPTPVFVPGTFDTVLPFEKTELGKKILEWKN